MKKSKLLIFILSMLFLCSFTVRDSIIVEQVTSDYPIVVRYNNKGICFRIHYPVVYRVKNLSEKKYKIFKVNYFYGNSKYSYSLYKEWCPVFVKQERDNKIIDAREKGRIIIDSLQTRDFIIQTAHSILEKDTFQSIIRPYINFHNKGDTLHLKNIKEIKKKYFNVLNSFLGNDSIMFWIEPLGEHKSGKAYILPIKIKLQ